MDCFTAFAMTGKPKPLPDKSLAHPRGKLIDQHHRRQNQDDDEGHLVPVAHLDPFGIGLQIAERIKVRYWDEASFIIILILATVMLIDQLSARVRMRLIG